MPKSHEELICWQLADELRQLIIKHTDPERVVKDFRFSSATCVTRSRRRAGTSRKASTKFRHKRAATLLQTARASLGETKDGIRDGHQRGYFSAETADEMTKLCGRAMIANLRWLQSLDRPDPK